MRGPAQLDAQPELGLRLAPRALADSVRIRSERPLRVSVSSLRGRAVNVLLFPAAPPATDLLLVVGGVPGSERCAGLVRADQCLDCTPDCAHLALLRQPGVREHVEELSSVAYRRQKIGSRMLLRGDGVPLLAAVQLDTYSFSYGFGSELPTSPSQLDSYTAYWLGERRAPGIPAFFCDRCNHPDCPLPDFAWGQLHGWGAIADRSALQGQDPRAGVVTHQLATELTAASALLAREPRLHWSAERYLPARTGAHAKLGVFAATLAGIQLCRFEQETDLRTACGVCPTRPCLHDALLEK